jgi:hypothetical protein
MASQNQLIQTMLQQFHLTQDQVTFKLNSLETKMDMMHSSSVGKGLLPTPEHHLSTFRTNPTHEREDCYHEEIDSIKKDGRSKF